MRRSHKRSYKRKTNKRKGYKQIRTRRNKKYSMRGGNYTEYTNAEINGIPITKNALITTDNGTFNSKEYIKHKEYQDFHGVGIDDDY